MTELDEWRRKMRESSTTDPEEIVEAARKRMDPNGPVFRLELLYDKTIQTVILQGNERGLQHLVDTLMRLLKSGSGAHAHFDSYSSLSKNDLDLIIQRVGDDDVGTHTVSDSTAK